MSYNPLGYSAYTPALAARQLMLAAQAPVAPQAPAEGKNPESLPVAVGPPMSVTNILAMARFPGMPDNLYQATAAAQAYLQTLADQSALYSARQNAANEQTKEGVDLWKQFMPYFSVDRATASAAAAHHGGYPYQLPGYSGLDLNSARRKNATRETTSLLKKWLYENRKNPYPTKGEKVMLAVSTQMSLTQVSTWFANARRRLKKENKMTWSPRNRTGDGEDSASNRSEAGEGSLANDGEGRIGDDDNVSLDLSDYGEASSSGRKLSTDSTEGHREPVSPLTYPTEPANGGARKESEAPSTTTEPQTKGATPVVGQSGPFVQSTAWPTQQYQANLMAAARRYDSERARAKSSGHSPSSPKNKIWSIADVATKSPSMIGRQASQPTPTFHPSSAVAVSSDATIRLGSEGRRSVSDISSPAGSCGSSGWERQEEPLRLTKDAPASRQTEDVNESEIDGTAQLTVDV